MTQSSADLIRGWQAERAILEQKIAELKTGATGHSLTEAQREAAIHDQSEAVADIESLLADFSRCEPFPIMFASTSQRAEPIIRLRLRPAAPEASFATAVS
jgi:hypothetical protein